MNIWDPFHPVAYFLHALLGLGGILCAIVALASTKGSGTHKLAGRLFSVAAAVAAATAIWFSFTNFAPLAIASAMMMLSVVASGILAHRGKQAWITVGEVAAAILMALVLAWLAFGVVQAVSHGGVAWIPPLVLALVACGMLVNDIRFIGLAPTARESRRLLRHVSRMGFAFAIAIHEPTVVFSDDLGVPLSVAFYAPLFIWPAIVFYFRNRIRSGAMTLEFE